MTMIRITVETPYEVDCTNLLQLEVHDPAQARWLFEAIDAYAQRVGSPRPTLEIKEWRGLETG